MMPGTSRSAASIIIGMQQGLSRQAAAEFCSFWLYQPYVSGYLLFYLLKSYEASGLKGYELILKQCRKHKMFIIGNVVAFIVVVLAIKFL